jgi:hypothetical protein
MTTLDVDPKTYYRAATNCFDAASALRDSFIYVFAELSGCGDMAGVDQDGKQWASSYDTSASEAVSFFTDVYSTLTAYGSTLNDLGFNHAQADASLKGTPQPTPPADPDIPDFGSFAVPASAGGTGQGIIDESINLASEIGIPVPDGNTGTLTKAADAWDRLGTIYQNTNARDKITVAAGLFDDVTAADAVQVREDLKSVSTSIDQLLTTCKQISQSCTDYKTALQELRDEIKGFLEDLVKELVIDALVTIGLAAVSMGAGAVTAIKSADTVRRWAKKIKDGIVAWRARKAVQIKGLADDAKTAMTKARQVVKDLFERLRKRIDEFKTARTQRGLDNLFRDRTPKASEVEKWAQKQGWTRSQTENGPIKYTDNNGVVRMTIKKGSDRAPGSSDPHVEIRDPSGQRIDPYGNPVTRKSPDNHTSIDWDLS